MTDAEVMVRRSERALGQAIRSGQERGEIRSVGQRGSAQAAYERERLGRVERVQGVAGDRGNSLPGPSDFAADTELSGNGAGIYHLTDGVTDDEFDEALDRAQDEGNVSRANVVRKVREVQPKRSDGPATGDLVADREKIASPLGFATEVVR